MHTALLLTVCPSMHCAGGCLPPGGVPAPGGGVCSRGWGVVSQHILSHCHMNYLRLQGISGYCKKKNTRTEKIRRNKKWIALLQKRRIFYEGFQWRIQDFPQGSANSKSGCANLLFCKFVVENCMKMKEFGPEEIWALTTDVYHTLLFLPGGRGVYDTHPWL